MQAIFVQPHAGAPSQATQFVRTHEVEKLTFRIYPDRKTHDI